MIPVEKYHGTGNDFIITEATGSVPDRRGFAMQYCDRTSGISYSDSPTTGADGVLFLALEPEYSPPRIVMTLVQPDGSVAAMCGNGARCAAAWAAARTGSDEVMIDTPAGTRHAVVEEDQVTIEMGQPAFTPDRVPLARDTPLIEEPVGSLTVTAVNTGVPHAVAFVDDVDDVDLEAVAPEIRHHAVFPQGANVTVASRRDDGGYDQRTFERGVEGETDSCGTGAVAVAAVAHELGYVETDQTVSIHPPGGDLEVTITERTALLRGPIVYDFSTEVAPSKPRTIEP